MQACMENKVFFVPYVVTDIICLWITVRVRDELRIRANSYRNFCVPKHRNNS